MNTDANRYSTLWRKFTEESLANMVSFQRFDSGAERKSLKKFIEKQPLEYSSCFFWKKMPPRYLEYSLKSWGRDRPNGRLVEQLLKTKTVDIIRNPRPVLSLRRLAERKYKYDDFWRRLGLSIMNPRV